MRTISAALLSFALLVAVSPALADKAAPVPKPTEVKPHTLQHCAFKDGEKKTKCFKNLAACKVFIKEKKHSKRWLCLVLPS